MKKVLYVLIIIVCIVIDVYFINAYLKLPSTITKRW